MTVYLVKRIDDSTIVTARTKRKLAEAVAAKFEPGAVCIEPVEVVVFARGTDDCW